MSSISSLNLDLVALQTKGFGNDKCVALSDSDYQRVRCVNRKCLDPLFDLNMGTKISREFDDLHSL